MLTPSSRRSVADRAAARVGTTVAEKYRIIRLLGVGGMAAVYAAKHRNGHRVAIKVLLEHLSDDSEMRQLFSREAYAANRVGHPGAVPVLDDDEDEDGFAFLIMPLLEGETLRARWERAKKKLPLAEVAVLLADALDVLASAHANGIVHRDIKPENLFATTDGQLRVLDFGIARRIDAELSATLTTRVMGTPAFVPPEQALGDRRAIGPRSDLWAVGATMFTLLSGKFVHQADSANAQIAAAATRHARSLAEVMPDMANAVVAFVNKALAFEQEDRWQSAHEMRDGLIFAVEEALGEPFAATTGRVRAQLMAELPAISAAQQGELLETTRDAAKARPSGSTPKGQARAESPQGKGRGELHTVGGIAGEPRRRARRIWGVVLQGLAVFALGGAVVTGVYRAVAERRAPPVASAATLDAGAVEVYSGKAEAVVQLKIGIQSFRDGSKAGASQSFAKAIEIDPNLAAAHLYASIVPPWPDESTRVDYHAASVLREGLGPRDRALLDAFAPAQAMPQDLEASEQRLVAARVAFPSDWLILWTLSDTYIKRGKISKGLEVLEDLSKREPSLAMAWREKGLAYALLDDQKRAREALNECLRISPYAQACLRLLAELEGNEGHCAEAERHARTLMAVPSPADESALYLAESIEGRGGNMQSVRDMLDRGWPLAAPPARESRRLEYDARFAVVTGAFAALDRITDAWAESVASMRYEEDHQRVFRIRAYAAMELGDRKRATQWATDYLAKRDAWLPPPYFDWEIEAARVQYLAGAISHDTFAKRRTAWLAREAARPELVEASSQRWIFAYGLSSATREDALEAIHVLPQYLPIIDALFRDPGTDWGFGNAYLLAGDTTNALPYLRRAAHACKILEYPFEETWASLHLGKALEGAGDVSGACAAYGVVVTRWGKEPRSTSAKFAHARRVELHCPEAPP